MATVPYSGDGPQVAPDTRPPDDYQRIETNPDMFGAGIGKGLDQLGAGIQHAQQFYGQVAVDDQVNKVMTAADTIRRGDPNKAAVGPDGMPILGSDGKPQPDLGYLGLHGEDAGRARAGADSRIDAAIAASRANLSTSEQQLEFDKQTRRMRSGWANEIAEHAERENQTWAVGVANASADQARQHIAANSDNQVELENGVNALLGARVKQAQLKYGEDPTIAADALANAKSEVAVTRVQALQNIDPLRAKTVLETNRTVLPPETYDNLVNRLRPMIAGASAPEAIQRAATGQPLRSGQPTAAAPTAGQPAAGSHRTLRPNPPLRRRCRRPISSRALDRALRSVRAMLRTRRGSREPMRLAAPHRSRPPLDQRLRKLAQPFPPAPHPASPECLLQQPHPRPCRSSHASRRLLPQATRRPGSRGSGRSKAVDGPTPAPEPATSDGASSRPRPGPPMARGTAPTRSSPCWRRSATPPRTTEP